MCKVIVCENSFSTESRKRNSIEMWVLHNGVSLYPERFYEMRNILILSIKTVVVPLKPDEKRVINHTRDMR